MPGEKRLDAKTTNNSNIYFDFIKNALNISKSTVAMIVPASWMTNNRMSNLLLKHGLSYIRQIDNSYFPTVAIRSCITSFIANNGYNGDIKIQTANMSFEINRHSILSFEDPIKIQIVNKLQSNNNFGGHLKYGLYGISKGAKGSLDRIIERDAHYSLIETAEFNTKVLIYVGGFQHPEKYLYSNQPNQFNKPGLAFPTISDKNLLGVTRLVSSDMGVSERLKVIYFDDMDHAINAKSFIESKLIRFVMRTTKHDDTVNTNKNSFNHIPIIDFTKEWTDQELYQHFGLTQEEIDYIESTIK